MLDIGWSEMFLIAVVAIVVIGPKELPRALRTVGQWIGKARAMTRDLQNSVNDMIAEAELEDLRKSAKSMTDFSAGNILDDPTSPTTNTASPPPPTPLKFPAEEGESNPEDDYDASDEELAEYQAELDAAAEAAAEAAAAETDASEEPKSAAKVTDA